MISSSPGAVLPALRIALRTSSSPGGGKGRRAGPGFESCGLISSALAASTRIFCLSSLVFSSPVTAYLPCPAWSGTVPYSSPACAS